MTACCWQRGAHGKCQWWVRAGHGAAKGAVHCCGPRRGAWTRDKAFAACPEPAQGLSHPKLHPGALLPLSCFAVAPLAGALEDPWVRVCFPVSWCRQWRCRCALSASHRSTAVAKTSRPVGSGSRPLTAASSVPGTIPQPNIVSCLVPGQGRRRGAAAAGQTLLSWAPVCCGGARQLPPLSRLPSQNYWDSEQGRACHILHQCGQFRADACFKLLYASLYYVFVLFIVSFHSRHPAACARSIVGWQEGAVHQLHMGFTSNG